MPSLSLKISTFYSQSSSFILIKILITQFQMESQTSNKKITWFNKIMFIHKSIYHRNYNFSHPLAGRVYDNKPFAQNFSQFVEEDIKLSTAGSQDLQRTSTHFKKQNHQEAYYTRREEVPRRQTCSAHHQATQDITQIRATTLFSRQSFSSKNKTTYGGSIPLNRDKALQSKNSEDGASRKGTKKRLKRKLAINHYVDSYLFPSIEMHIINKINQVGQIPRHSFNFSFQKIFKKIISTQLMGEFTSNFMLKMQRYIRKIVGEGASFEDRQNVVLEQSLKGISRKNDLLDTIAQLQMNDEDQKVQKLVKYYCVPGDKQSQQILQGLMSQIVIDLYEKKNCRKDIEYCLLTESGDIISHISEIFFTTRVLLIAPFNQHEVCFTRYKKILEDHDKEQRMTFKQSIKHNFINKIVHHKVQNKLVNYHSDPKENDQYRKQVQEQAEALLQNKSKLRLQKNKQTPTKDILPSDLFLSSPPFSRQSTYNSFLSRKHKQKRQYKEMVLKLHKILDPNNKYTVKSRVDRQTEQEFNNLFLKNDKYDLTFNYNPDHSNKLIFKNILENCSLFKKMRPSQIKLVKDVIDRLYGQGRQLRQIQFWQFKEILETAHGISDKSIIMKFVLNYLPFDEWGEVSKKDMFALIQAAVSLEGRTLEMLQRITWNWFERSRLIENNALRKKNLEIWYQPVRVSYLLLLSIMFGGEYRSMGDMVADLAKYQFYCPKEGK